MKKNAIPGKSLYLRKLYREKEPVDTGEDVGGYYFRLVCVSMRSHSHNFCLLLILVIVFI